MATDVALACDLDCQVCALYQGMPKVQEIGPEPFIGVIESIRDSDGEVVMDASSDALMLYVILPFAHSQFANLAGSLVLDDAWPDLRAALTKALQHHQTLPRVGQGYCPPGAGVRGIWVSVVIPIPLVILEDGTPIERVASSIEEAAAHQIRIFQLARRTGMWR